MSDYINIVLSSGRSVKVYSVPPYVINAVLSKFKEPAIPTRPVNPEVDIPGANQQIPDPENPEYKQLVSKHLMDRAAAFVDARLLYGLRDEIPPDRWPALEDKEKWEFLGINIDIPEKGEGRRLAWIKFGVLSSQSDMDIVMGAIDSFNTISQAEVNALIDSFRNPGSRNTAQ